MQIPCAYPIMMIEDAKPTAPVNYGNCRIDFSSRLKKLNFILSFLNYTGSSVAYQNSDDNNRNDHEHSHSFVGDYHNDSNDSQNDAIDSQNKDGDYHNHDDDYPNNDNPNDDTDSQNEAADHHKAGDYNHHNNDNYNQNDDDQDGECDDDDFRRLSLFKSPEIFRILSIQTIPTDMKSRLHEYSSRDSFEVCEVNGVELSFHIEGELGNKHPELKQFLCVYIVQTRVTIKNGDILPHGVFLSSNIIDGIIHLHFINVDKDCSVHSIPSERLDMSICPLDRVLTSDPFYMENLLPQKYMKYLTDYCRSIQALPIVQSDNQQLVHDDDIYIDDENDVVGKLIVSSKKPRKNSRHFVPDPNNILSTNRSSRTRNKPAEDKSILPVSGLEAGSAKKKKIMVIMLSEHRRKMFILSIQMSQRYLKSNP